MVLKANFFILSIFDLQNVTTPQLSRTDWNQFSRERNSHPYGALFKGIHPFVHSPIRPSFVFVTHFLFKKREKVMAHIIQKSFTKKLWRRNFIKNEASFCEENSELRILLIRVLFVSVVWFCSIFYPFLIVFPYFELLFRACSFASNILIHSKFFRFLDVNRIK